MGEYIVGLLHLFADHVNDAESNAHITNLVANPTYWSASHASFDEVRSRWLAAERRNDRKRMSQYSFEESCCQATYNAIEPSDPFDASSAFFVVVQAIGFAILAGVPLEELSAVLTRAS
jgi:hypothetical protein